jgi:hypothetical protein
LALPRPRKSDAVGRLWGLDQARAVAIMAMILAHFAPGVFARMPALQGLHDPVMWFGRMATPAFMAIFGVTAGFVFLPRYVRSDSRETTRRLLRRSVVVFVCALLIAAPHWVRFASHGETNPWEYAFVTYSVLLFYTFGVASLPLWLHWLAKNTVPKSVIAGTALWGIGTAAYYLWPQQDKSLPEFVRMMLVSGNYGYFQMMGVTLLAIPVGLSLRRGLESGNGPYVLATLFAFGLLVSLTGALWGYWIDEFVPARIVSGDLRIPARPWYFLFFGGVALAMIPALELVTRLGQLRKIGYPLALFGQASLLLFTGHAFVLPAVELIDRFGSLRGIGRVAVPLVLFAVFCAVVIYLRHRLNSRRSAAKGQAPRRVLVASS